MSLKDEWDRLDSGTRRWLLENPACLVLPPAMSAKFGKDARTDIACDRHGQVVLSPEDHDFIREKAEAAGIIRVPQTEYRFFDTAPLPTIRTAPPERAPQRNRMKSSKTSGPPKTQ
ncbi:hypothetical protein GCM10023346_37990 [Arthrobacter gyeryongensis]|uniref:Uncharacterized protein n=1 Tax=Arthrobacter gyeryongensis TaxID=1650592 RepID=A0ABP9SPE8_9MICC